MNVILLLFVQPNRRQYYYIIQNKDLLHNTKSHKAPVVDVTPPTLEQRGSEKALEENTSHREW